MLDQLKKDVKLNQNQFGGIKGTGVDHFLIETWNEVLTALEDPNAAASLMSIDFEKAFNRMSHPHCLEALSKLNADSRSISLVHAFLYGRTMKIKVGQTMSQPRSVPGGSPQGSILGNFLFCVATNELGEAQHWGREVGEAAAQSVSFGENGISGSDVSGYSVRDVAPIAPPDLADLPDSDDSFSFQYFRRKRNILDDTVLSERCCQTDIDKTVALPVGWVDVPLATKVYIDDLNNIEKVKQSTAICSISEAQMLVLPHATKSEENFNSITRRAEEIGMKVNEGKTQLLCISGNNNIKVTSYIRPESGKEIKSSEELKILGFWFGTKPTVDVHVNKLKEKFRSRLWSLRHLKRSGMASSDLLYVYQTVLRPVLDFAVPTYHSLLTVTQSNSLETLQKKAFKIIYGSDLSYAEALAVANMQPLSERRQKLVENFAVRTQKNPRYSDGWFPKKTNKHYSTRSNRPYLEVQTRTERMKRNPITYMRRVLNDLIEA